MRITTRALGLAALLVLAGCSGAIQETDTTSTTTTATTVTTADTTTSTTTSTKTTTTTTTIPTTTTTTAAPTTTQESLTRPTDAVDREYPWPRQNLTVYVNTENVSSGYVETKTMDQIEHAFEYFEDGADGHLETNVSFERVDSERRADIVIDFPDTVTCGDKEAVEGYSCGSVYGMDTDADDELEYYDEASIQLAGIPRETRGWHVGRWLAYAFGLRDGDLPAVFKNSDYNARSDRWWE